MLLYLCQIHSPTDNLKQRLRPCESDYLLEVHQPTVTAMTNRSFEMSVYLTLLTLLIPFSAFANLTFPPAPVLSTRFQPLGDTLNITRCYCESPDWAIDNTYGYYYLWTYHNHHLWHDYPLEVTCKSIKNVKPGPVPECLKNRLYEKALHD